jgi:hypothetical protein
MTYDIPQTVERIIGQVAAEKHITTDEALASLVMAGFEAQNEGDNYDYLFTPERMAHIDEALEAVERGEFFTSEQVDKHLAAKRAEWLSKNRP